MHEGAHEQQESWASKGGHESHGDPPSWWMMMMMNMSRTTVRFLLDYSIALTFPTDGGSSTLNLTPNPFCIPMMCAAYILLFAVLHTTICKSIWIVYVRIGLSLQKSWGAPHLFTLPWCASPKQWEKKLGIGKKSTNAYISKKRAETKIYDNQPNHTRWKILREDENPHQNKHHTTTKNMRSTKNKK